MEILPSLVFFLIFSGVSTYLMALAYKNTKFTLKHKMANKREEAVTREMNQLLADDKKMSRKEKDER
jgi:translocon-associated protein subunit gamma